MRATVIDCDDNASPSSLFWVQPLESVGRVGCDYSVSMYVCIELVQLSYDEPGRVLCECDGFSRGGWRHTRHVLEAVG